MVGLVLPERRGHGGPVDDVVFAADAIVTVSSDHTARWWSKADGQPVESRVTEQALLSCAADGSGRIIAAGGIGGDVIIFIDRSEWKRIPEAHAGAVYTVALSADGSRLLTTGADGMAKLWGTVDGTVLRTFRGHRGPVLAGAMTDHVVATGSSDATARRWDVQSGRQLDQMAGMGGRVAGVDLTAGGALIATSAKGHVRVLEPRSPPGREPPRADGGTTP